MGNRPSNNFRQDFVLYIKELWAASKPVFKKWWILLNIPVAIVDVIVLYSHQDIPSSDIICAGTTLWIIVTLFYAGFQAWRELGQDQPAVEVTPNRPPVEIDPKERHYLDGRLRAFEKEEAWFVELAGDAVSESPLDVFRDDYTPGQVSRETYTDICEVVDDLDRFVLVGDPGAGKTFTLLKLATDMARARLAGGEEVPLPLWIHLGTETDATNAGELLHHWWQQYDLPSTLEGYLNSLNLCLFLDGLDEMPGGKDWVGLLRDLVKQHPKMPVFVACRVHDYDEGLRLDLPVVRIAPLDETRIERFAQRRLRELADIFLRALNTDARRSMAANPYFLAMMTEVFVKQMKLPSDLHDLYEKHMDVRYEKYAERGLMQLSWAQLKKSLQDLAFRMIRDSKGTTAASEWMQRQVKLPVALRDGISLGALVQDEETGLMRFYHQSLQGYFALPGLMQALEPDVPVEDRERFIYQIGKLRKAGAPAVPAIIGVLGDESEDVRRAAAIVLGLLGEPAAEIVPVLTEALHDESRHVYMAAASALGWFGASAAEAVPALAGFLENEHEETCQAAAETLGLIGESAMPVLTEALNNKNEDRRKAAASGLGRVGAPAVPALIKALGDESERVRSAAVFSLGVIGPAAAEAAPELIASLSDESESVRRTAAWALADIGSFAAAEAVSALANALTDKNAGVRREVAKALGQVNAPAAETVPVLISVLSDENAEVKGAAIWSLGEIGKPAIPMLIDALSDQRPEVRAAAAKALGRIGPAAAGAVPALIDVLCDKNQLVCQGAAYALEHIGTPRALATLHTPEIRASLRAKN
jgi:HEAT repeat protein